MPNIIGDFAFSTGVNGAGTWLKADYAWGAMTLRGSGNTAVLSQASTFNSTNSFRFDASQYNSAIYGTGANSAVYAKHIQMKAIIKY